MKKLSLLATLGALALSVSMPATAKGLRVNQGMTQAEVLAAQQAWCEALVDISQTHARDGQLAAKALAKKVIDGAYGYQP